MKVGFIGTHCSGKTTLVKHFADDDRFTAVQSLSREARQYGVALNSDATPFDQLLLSTGRIGYRPNDDRVHILDRTPLDTLSYTLHQEENSWIRNDTRIEYMINNLMTMVYWDMQTYDKLFYFPIYWPVVPTEDGVRSTDETYRDYIDTITQYHLKDLFQLPFETIPNLNTEGRAEFVLQHLGLV